MKNIIIMAAILIIWPSEGYNKKIFQKRIGDHP